MFAVIFKVQPKQGRFDDYLNLAKQLKPELAKIDGFIDNERFRSQRTNGLLLSLSTWRDEKAVIRWRTLELHHKVQERGRSEVFEDYHLRVGEVAFDNAVPDGQKLQRLRLDETETSQAKVVTISEPAPAKTEAPSSASTVAELQPPHSGADGLIDCEQFESITNAGKTLLLASWRNAAAAEHWQPCMAPNAKLRHRHVAIIRDYGMIDRREAPQYYADVAL